jgi:DNA-binding HxlR family transcriptional regulator
MPRRSYSQYCPLSRALDVIGERWAALIIRELLAGPRRYTDLHADLPGVSTDVLATRLKEMEQDGLVTRRRLAPPAAATVYELTPRGRALLPALTALAGWGAADLSGPRPTDARRAHWFAIPLLDLLAGQFADPASSGEATGTGTVNIVLDDGTFHIVIGTAGNGYGHGPAEHPDAQLTFEGDAPVVLARGEATLPEMIEKNQIRVDGDGPLAQTLRKPARLTASRRGG